MSTLTGLRGATFPKQLPLHSNAQLYNGYTHHLKQESAYLTPLRNRSLPNDWVQGAARTLLGAKALGHCPVHWVTAGDSTALGQPAAALPQVQPAQGKTPKLIFTLLFRFYLSFFYLFSFEQFSFFKAFTELGSEGLYRPRSAPAAQLIRIAFTEFYLVILTNQDLHIPQESRVRVALSNAALLMNHSFIHIYPPSPTLSSSPRITSPSSGPNRSPGQ